MHKKLYSLILYSDLIGNEKKVKLFFNIDREHSQIYESILGIFVVVFARKYKFIAAQDLLRKKFFSAKPI